MTFTLPELKGDRPRNKHIIYFSCDPKYWDYYGWALASSVLRYMPEMSVHCHLIIYDKKPKFELIKDKRITYSWETISTDFIKSIPVAKDKMSEGETIFNTKDHTQIILKTYLASVRFMRMSQIFKEDQRVLQLDCDTVLQKPFYMQDFDRLTALPAVMPKPKDPNTFIASCLSPGIGVYGEKFKKEFADAMIDGFCKGAYWYIDQHILKEVMKSRRYIEIPYDWNSWGMKRSNIFVTGKGDRKHSLRYKRIMRHFCKPEHRKQIEKEIEAVLAEMAPKEKEKFQKGEEKINP